MRKLLIIMLAAVACSCGDSKLKRENAQLKEEIEERREALEGKKKRELASARMELTHTDSLLDAVRREHDELHRRVMSASTRLNDHSPEVLRLNALRASLDSLGVEYQKQVHKVKFYLRKEKK